ncbi:MAG: DUF1887 family protein [Nitrospirae bacterium]|nr:DUF1887 family protein [Nitrospirota bacterium]
MSHIHVCLVSDQPIPNILGIYHFKPDKVIFCSTDKMEKLGKVDDIINTLKLYGLDYSQRLERIIVDQDCLEDCETRFANDIAQKYIDHELIVNLTGGTKIMVLAAYNVFKDMAEQMIYTPIPKNEFLTVFPRTGECKSPETLDLRLSVQAYITAYGVKVSNSHNLDKLKSNASNREVICKWMIQNYQGIENLLSEFYKALTEARSKKREAFLLNMDCQLRSQQEKELMRMFNIPEERIEKSLTRDDILFLTGDWLSDFCYNEIKKLPVDDCVTGIVLISPKGTNNEFDVMFTKDNAFFIVECKSLKQIHDKDADILYKISALQHDFGLRVNGFLVSTARSILDVAGNIKDSTNRRADQCKSKVIHPDEIYNFREWIKSYVKGLT